MTGSLVQVTDGLWCLPTAASCYLIGSSAGLIVLDPGLPGAGAGVLAAVARIATSARYPPQRPAVAAIVLSHWHADHSGAALEVAEASGAPVYAGTADAAVLRGDAPGQPPVLGDDERELYEQISSAGGVVMSPPPVPAVRDADDDEPALAALGARVVTVGGHTAGSIALHLPTARVVLTGDLARSDDGPLVLGRFHQDPPAARAALAALASLHPRVAGVGHGLPVTSGVTTALLAAAGTPTATPPPVQEDLS